VYLNNSLALEKYFDICTYLIPLRRSLESIYIYTFPAPEKCLYIYTHLTGAGEVFIYTYPEPEKPEKYLYTPQLIDVIGFTELADIIDITAFVTSTKFLS